MNKITQTLLSTTTAKILLVAFLLFSLQVNAQNGIVGSGFTNGWTAGDVVGFDPVFLQKTAAGLTDLVRRQFGHKIGVMPVLRQGRRYVRLAAGIRRIK